MLALLKRHPILSATVVLVILLLGLSQLPGGRPWLLRYLGDVPFSDHELTVKIPPEGVMLRWNALVNPWRHPSQNLTFQTELKLRLLFANSSWHTVRIEAVRLLSEWQGKEIVWEALWLAEERDWVPGSPIEAQIQQHRAPLHNTEVGARESARSLVFDFAPLDYPRHLTKGTYHNRLQVKLADKGQWQDLLSFSFTIPENFALVDSRGNRYQYWQPFPVGQFH